MANARRYSGVLDRVQSGRRTRFLRSNDKDAVREEPSPLDEEAASFGETTRTRPARQPAEQLSPYGICLSGGGIRSASFSLGVLQRMTEKGMLHGSGKERATYLSCVSGGGYIGTALTMLTKGRFHEPPPEGGEPPGRRGSAEVPEHQPAPIMHGFAPDSPEEKYLRNHTRYLTHGWGGPVGAIWRLLLGIGWNTSILALGVLVFAVPMGWVYGGILDSLREHCQLSCGPHSFSFQWWPTYIVAIALGGIGVLVGLAWVGRPWRREGTRRALLGVSLGFLAAAAAWMVVVVAIPIALEAVRWTFSLSQQSGTVKLPSGPTPVATPAQSTVAIGATSLGGIVLSALTALLGARSLRRAEVVSDAIPTGVRKKIAAGAQALILRYRTPLLNLLASLIAPFSVLALLLLGLHLGSLFVPLTGGTDYGVAVFCSWLGGAAALLGIWLFADVTAWSMHSFYRERLSDAFVLERVTTDGRRWSPTAVQRDGHWIDADRRSYNYLYRISEGQPEDFPELLLCASANVSTYGTAPTGAPVSSFVFSQSEIGGPLVGGWSAQTYEAAVGDKGPAGRTVTLPGAMAMSGAAISPEMGRDTRAPLRFLLTMMNIRLGAWVPNPNRLAEFAARTGWVRRLRTRPRMWYLLREMLGKNDPQSMFLYVTDGGHYENLGLVELIRRSCRYIWCVDASGEQQGTFSTIAAAVALAYNELGIRVDIDPAAQMAPAPTKTEQRARHGLRPVVKRTFALGTIRYGDDPAEWGRLVVIKAGVPEDAPQDVLDFYQANASFPSDPTLDQLYIAQRFDAYRSLGAFAADQALAHCEPDFRYFLDHGTIRV
jgi:hypothetical protein